jgi:hypothetical protein
MRPICLLWLATVLAVSTSGCAHESGLHPGVVKAFQVDTKTNAVVAATIVIPYRFVSGGRGVPRFYMKTNHGTTTVWKSARMARHEKSAIVTLVPMVRNAPGGPMSNDMVVVYFDKRPGGALAVLPPAHVLPPPPSPAPILNAPAPILNADFSVWTGADPNLTPAGWFIRSSKRTSYDVRPFSTDNQGVRISVATTPVQRPGVISTPIPNSTATVALAQSMTLTDSRLQVNVRPFQPCLVRGRRIIAATGMEVSNRYGDRELFCVGRFKYTGRVLMAGQVVPIEILPGRVGAWNLLKIDVTRIVRAKKSSPITLSFFGDVDTSQSPYDWITMDVSTVQSVP